MLLSPHRSKEKEKEAAVAAAAAAAAAASQPRVVLTRSHSDQKDFREVPKGQLLVVMIWGPKNFQSGVDEAMVIVTIVAPCQ